MRHFPNVISLRSEGRSHDSLGETVDLKSWQAHANSEDLYALYKGTVENLTGYRLHDLLFGLFYTNPSARHFRNEIQVKFRELIEGETTVEELRDMAAGKFLILPETAKEDVTPLIPTNDQELILSGEVIGSGMNNRQVVTFDRIMFGEGLEGLHDGEAPSKDITG